MRQVGAIQQSQFNANGFFLYKPYVEWSSLLSLTN